MTPLRDKAIQTALIGDWNSAILTNKQLLDENPEDIDALNRLALAFTITGKVNKAKTTYQAVLKLDPLNPIASRNLKNLKTSKNSKSSVPGGFLQLNNNFIEESGKTKVVELINITQPSVIQSLRTGESVDLCIKRQRIFVLKNGKQYIGVLPDDIGKRLIKLLRAGNKYEAYLKSLSPHKVVVFIKELKRAARFKNQPSFLVLDSSLVVRPDRVKNKEDDEETENYEEDEDVVL